jgi:hypothetical protein
MSLQNRQQTNKLIFDTRTVLSELDTMNVSVSFYWTKSHIGIDGNERAHSLARGAADQGANQDFPLHVTDVPKSYLKTVIRKKVMRTWQLQWCKEERGRWTRTLLPTVGVDITSCLDYNMSQFISGHGMFGSYLQRFNLMDNDVCICGDNSTSPQHIITSCPFFALSPIDWTLVSQGRFAEVAQSREITTFRSLLNNYFKNLRRLRNNLPL